MSSCGNLGSGHTRCKVQYSAIPRPWLSAERTAAVLAAVRSGPVGGQSVRGVLTEIQHGEIWGV